MSAHPPSDFVLDVLRLVQRSGGRATFYTLDRALTYAPQLYGRTEAWDPGVIGGGLMVALRELEQGGFVRSQEHQTDRTRQTVYDVTGAGRQRVGETAVAAEAA